MSFETNQNHQISLTDSFVNLSPRTQRIVMNSWCKYFADIFFPTINEERFSILYSSNKFSRPNTPVNFNIADLMLKEKEVLVVKQTENLRTVKNLNGALRLAKREYIFHLSGMICF